MKAIAKYSICIVFLVFAVPTLADTSKTIDQKLAAMSESYMSPYCPGRTISGCPSPQAIELRDEIRQSLVEGKTEAEIEEELVARFGPEITGKPKGVRERLLGWGAPFAFLLLGLLVVLVFVKKSRLKPESSAETNASSASPEVEEIRKRLL